MKAVTIPLFGMLLLLQLLLQNVSAQGINGYDGIIRVDGQQCQEGEVWYSPVRRSFTDSFRETRDHQIASDRKETWYDERVGPQCHVTVAYQGSTTKKMVPQPISTIGDPYQFCGSYSNRSFPSMRIKGKITNGQRQYICNYYHNAEGSNDASETCQTTVTGTLTFVIRSYADNNDNIITYFFPLSNVRSQEVRCKSACHCGR